MISTSQGLCSDRTGTLIVIEACDHCRGGCGHSKQPKLNVTPCTVNAGLPDSERTLECHWRLSGWMPEVCEQAFCQSIVSVRLHFHLHQFSYELWLLNGYSSNWPIRIAVCCAPDPSKPASTCPLLVSNSRWHPMTIHTQVWALSH